MPSHAFSARQDSPRHSRWLVAAGYLALAMGQITTGAETAVPPAPDARGCSTPGFQHCGLYVHACWLYNYPFATHRWSHEDYDHMFRLLKLLGYDRVMLWPMMEGIPMPMSAEDAGALRDYRKIIEDAHQAGLECWLTQSLCTTDRKIAEKPWLQRNFYAVRKDVRLDDPAQAEPWFKHEAAMVAILNNADAYVTIDSDPGGYVGAKAEDFVKVFQHDRRTIDRVGVRPKQQKVMPWVWGGWGIKSWQEPLAPRLARLCARVGGIQGGHEGRLGIDARPQRRRVRLRTFQHASGGKGRLDVPFDPDAVRQHRR